MIWNNGIFDSIIDKPLKIKGAFRFLSYLMRSMRQNEFVHNFRCLWPFDILDVVGKVDKVTFSKIEFIL